jgi:hypothetical protein
MQPPPQPAAVELRRRRLLALQRKAAKLNRSIDRLEKATG